MVTIGPSRRLDEVTEYYFSKKLQEIRDLEAQGRSILNLGIGNPDLPPSDSTVEKLVQSARDPNHHGYQSYRSIPELREAIAVWSHQKYGLDLDPGSEILPLIGSKEGIMHLSMAFLNPGDKILIPNPGYPVYRAAGRLAGANVQTYDLTNEKGWQIDVEQIQSQDLSQVKIMWINYPHMPTGATASEKLFDSLVELAHNNGFLLVNDNPYSLILNENPISILKENKAHEVALELNSLSKSHNMAGWRLGWLSGASQYLQAVLRFKSNMDSGMFLPIQHAGVEALKNPDSWHKQQNQILAKRRSFVWKILDLLDCQYDPDQVGLFVWARIPSNVQDVGGFVDDIMNGAGVFISPGFIFGSNGARYVRISLCNDEEILSEAEARVKHFVEAKVHTQ